MPSIPLSAFTYNSPVAFFIPQTPPEDISQEHPAVQQGFGELYNAMQQVISTFINNCGIGPQPQPEWAALAGSPTTILSGNLRRLYVVASEALPNGAIINLFNSAGVLAARNANATDNTKPADGFCSTPGGIAAGAAGEVQLSTGIVSINGLTIGTRYFLSITNGLVTATKPVAAGNIEQYVGIAIDSTHLYLDTNYWIQH